MVSYRTMDKWLVLPDANIVSETKSIVKYFDNDRGQVYSCVLVNVWSGASYGG